MDPIQEMREAERAVLGPDQPACRLRLYTGDNDRWPECGKASDGWEFRDTDGQWKPVCPDHAQEAAGWERADGGPSVRTTGGTT